MSDEGKLRKQIRLSSHTHKFGGYLYEMLMQESANQAVDEAWRDIQTKATHTVKVWVQDTPMKSIPEFPEATQGTGHFENRKAILLSDVAVWLKEAT